MEVKFNSHVEPVGRSPLGPHKRSEVPLPADSAIFNRSLALNEALEKTQVARPEFVRRGQELIGDVEYPPRQTIRQIATLLAMRLSRDAGETPPVVE
jgi:hypothetical protein